MKIGGEHFNDFEALSKLDGEHQRARIFAVRKGLLYTWVEGLLDEPVAKTCVQGWEAAIAQHAPATVFMDWFAVTKVDASARSGMATWARGHFHIMKSVHWGVASPFVAAALSATNILAGLAGVQFVSHSKRDSFDRALGGIMAGGGRLL